MSETLVKTGGLAIAVKLGDGYAEFRLVTPKRMASWEGEFLAEKLGYREWSFSLFQSKRRERLDAGGNPIGGFEYVTTWTCYRKPEAKQ